VDETRAERVIMHAPTEGERKRLLATDPKLFTRTVKTDLGEHKTLDLVLIHPGLGKIKLIEMCRRIIVPQSAVKQVEKLLANLRNPPGVVALEGLGLP
jgi:hypothetical protein